MHFGRFFAQSHLVTLFVRPFFRTYTCLSVFPSPSWCSRKVMFLFLGGRFWMKTPPPPTFPFSHDKLFCFPTFRIRDLFYRETLEPLKKAQKCELKRNFSRIIHIIYKLHFCSLFFLILIDNEYYVTNNSSAIYKVILPYTLAGIRTSNLLFQYAGTLTTAPRRQGPKIFFLVLVQQSEKS
jgi:hypothetical protein